MILIFGGSYQGKLDFAKEKYNLKDSHIFQCKEGTKEIDFSKKLINSFHLFIFESVKHNKNILEFISNNINEFKDKIVICDDINSGIVPIDKTMREFREAVGRCLVFLSKNSDEVIRVFCGMGTKLK